MAPSLQVLSALKAAQLKTLNRCMGLTFSGTKPVLLSHQVNLDYRHARRILSIDMGIRNLAYCVIAPPKAQSSASRSARTYRITTWCRQELEVPPSITAFAILARDIAIGLLKRYPDVDTILIERQRWRTGGLPAIQQWTVNVNTLEAMLHACFLCLIDGETQAVQTVDPSRVKHYYGTTGKTERKNVLKEMLNSGEVIIEGDTKMWDAPTGKSGKKDDLADCLLQALTWLQWQENRRRFLEEDKLPQEVFGDHAIPNKSKR